MPSTPLLGLLLNVVDSFHRMCFFGVYLSFNMSAGVHDPTSYIICIGGSSDEVPSYYALNFVNNFFLFLKRCAYL